MTAENTQKLEAPKPTKRQEARLTADYRQGQFDRLSERSGEYQPKVKFIGTDNNHNNTILETNYMNITAEELEAIEKILTKAALPPKVNIFSAAGAMQNCVEVKRTNAEGADWYSIHQDRIESTLLEILPQGSGIDLNWRFDITDKAIFCYNSYHRMRENGMYVGWIDFQIKICTNHRTIDGKIDFTITGKFGKYQDIKDYLYEIIGYGLDAL